MDRNLILAIISTLNEVEVHGEKNMDKLLGCIQALNGILTKGDDDNG